MVVDEGIDACRVGLQHLSALRIQEPNFGLRDPAPAEGAHKSVRLECAGP